MSKPVHGNVVSIYLEPNKPLRAAVAVMDTVIIDNQILDLEGNPVDLTECTVIVTATDRNGTILYTVSVTNAEQGRFRVIVQPRVHGQLKLTAKVSIDGAADQYTWFIGSLSVAVDEDGDPAEAIRSLTDDILDAYQRAKEVADDTKGYSADAKRYSDLALGYSINSQNTANESAIQAQIAKEYAEAAHTSELNAGQSAKEALASAANASDSANAAEASAATATQKAQEASASAESASASATSASASASQAADSASSASTSASQAKTSETNAKASEANASTYASSALSSANTAKAMATDAQTFAGQASDSADSASASAVSASSSADTATSGASIATAQAVIATEKATASANSASQAATSASAAKTSETNALATYENVLSSQATVDGYLSDALKAVTDSASNAESAATSATNASNSATEASNSAQSASASATSASSSADTATAGASTATAQAAIATDKATASANSASQASASATAAKASETNAKKALNDVLASQETVNGYLSDALKAVTDSASNAEAAATSATNASNSATAASNSAQSALASKNSASSSAESAQNSANRAKELADSLIIDNLDQRYLAINGNAASATKLATARKINGVSFDGTTDITVSDDTKLPLSGGTMTGTVFTTTPYIIRVPKNDGFININGDTDNGGGGYIQVYGRSHSTNPGEIKLIANTTNSAKTLRLFPDGRMTWNGNNVITSAGGTLNGKLYFSNDVVIGSTTNSGVTRIDGGTNYDDGAFLALHGINWKTSANAGAFQLDARDGSGNIKELWGYPDGRLIWVGRAVEREYDKVAGGVSFDPSGLQIYTTSITISGVSAGSTVSTSTITFPKAFAATPMVVALPSNPNVQVAWYSLTGTMVNFQVKNTSSGGVGTVVINVIVIGGL